jgi:hypothetical protein
LLCLFTGDPAAVDLTGVTGATGIVQTVDIHLAPETMHFGIDAEMPPYTKTVRNGPTVQVPWKDQAHGVIDIDALAQALQKAKNVSPDQYKSGQFALDMIAGVQKVRIVVNSCGCQSATSPNSRTATWHVRCEIARRSLTPATSICAA